MFIRKQSRKGSSDRYLLVENVRQGSRVRQRNILLLGRYPSVTAALEGWKAEIKELREWANRYRVAAQRFKKHEWPKEELGWGPPVYWHPNEREWEWQVQHYKYRIERCRKEIKRLRGKLKSARAL